MRDPAAVPLLDPKEFRAIRLLLGERGREIRDPALLVNLQTRGLVRLDDILGWVVTYDGHRRFLQTLAATF